MSYRSSIPPRGRGQGGAIHAALVVGAAIRLAGGFVVFAVGQLQRSADRDTFERLAAEVARLQVPVTRDATGPATVLPVAPGIAPAPAPEPAPALDVATVVPEAATAPATPPVEIAATTEAATVPSATRELARITAETPDIAAPRDPVQDALAAVHRNRMRMLTEGVVAGLYSVTEEDGTGTGTRIGLSTRNASTTAAEIEDLLRQASADGVLDLPAEITTPEGEADTSTLLFELVQRSLAQGDEREAAAAAEMRQRAFVASRAQTETQEGERFYVVRSGDSLAYIALQFYGSIGAYDRIFAANGDILDSPDRIQVGQRLRIPEA